MLGAVPEGFLINRLPLIGLLRWSREVIYEVFRAIARLRLRLR